MDKAKATYAGILYNIIKVETIGLDSVYKDYIVQMIGVYGLAELESAGLLETCGVVNGRQLYVLANKEMALS